MVKNLAVAVWGSATFKESSVTGVACNRYKDHAVRPGTWTNYDNLPTYTFQKKEME